MDYLLLCLLFLYDIECTQNQHINGWHIQREGAVRERKRLYDCNVMGILCSQKNCAAFADTTKTLPTENIYNNQEKLKDTIRPVRFGDFDLLCVSNNFFRVAEPMSGIVQNGGRLEWVELKPVRKGSGWLVERVETTRNMAVEKEQRELEDRGAAQISQHIPCKAAQPICNRNLKSCIQNEMQYPYLTVDINKDKFNQIATCEDKGKIEGAQCTQVLCTEKGGTDDNEKGKDINNGIPAIIQCESGNKAHLIYYHISADRWCLSKYETNEFNHDENAITLEQMLSKQVVDPDQVAFILKHEYDPFVKSFWFFGDAFKALKDKLPSDAYNEIEGRGLINWKLSFDNMYPSYKNFFKKLRRCEFDIPDPKKNCKGKTVTPWDLLQLAVIQRVLPSALRQTINVPPNSAVKPDDKVNEEINKAERENAKNDAKRGRKSGRMKADDVVEKEQENKSNNYLTLSVLSILIPIVLIIMSGLYMFYI